MKLKTKVLKIHYNDNIIVALVDLKKGESKPMWMVRGVPAIEKGINQGYELQEN